MYILKYLFYYTHTNIYNVKQYHLVIIFTISIVNISKTPREFNDVKTVYTCMFKSKKAPPPPPENLFHFKFNKVSVEKQL